MNLRKEARGRECQVRIPGICCGDSSTVVLAHLNGGGMGMKRPDTSGAWACSSCHSFVDGGYTRHLVDKETADLLHLEGVIRTQEILIAEGKIKW